jgi:acyl carrier protein
MQPVFIWRKNLSTKNTVIEMLPESANANLSKFPNSLTDVEFMQLIMSIEENFNIEIFDEEAENIRSLEDLISTIEKCKDFDMKKAA